MRRIARHGGAVAGAQESRSGRFCQPDLCGAASAVTPAGDSGWRGDGERLTVWLVRVTLGINDGLGVLSNVDRDLLAGRVRRFDVGFGFVVTADEVRPYKPSTFIRP